MLRSTEKKGKFREIGLGTTEIKVSTLSGVQRIEKERAGPVSYYDMTK